MTIVNMVGGGGGTINTVAGRTKIGTPEDFGFVGLQGTVDVGVSTIDDTVNPISGFIRTSPSTGFVVNGSNVIFYVQDGMNMNVNKSVTAPEQLSSFIGDDEDGNYLFLPSSATDSSTTIYRVNKTTFAIDTFMTISEHIPQLISKGHPLYSSSSTGIVEYVDSAWVTKVSTSSSGTVLGASYPFVFLYGSAESWKLYNLSTSSYQNIRTSEASSGIALCFNGSVSKKSSLTPPFIYSDGTIPSHNKYVYGPGVIVDTGSRTSYYVYFTKDGVEYPVAKLRGSISRGSVMRMTVDVDTRDYSIYPINIKGTIFG